jgi:hypothetical protein
LKLTSAGQCEVTTLDSLNRFQDLTELELYKSHCAVSDILKLKRLKQLQKLNLHDYNQIEPLLEALAESNQIQDLALVNAHANRDCMKIISRIHSLRWLDLSKNDAIQDDDLKYLSGLPNLKGLSLAGCNHLSVDALPTLSQLPIQWLCLEDKGADTNRTIRKALPERIHVVFSQERKGVDTTGFGPFLSGATDLTPAARPQSTRLSK